VVDLRTSSPTYGVWDSAILSAENKASVLVSEGLGHGFLALEDHSTVRYLCTSEYDPDNERVINPLDSLLAIPLSKIAQRFAIEQLFISDKDSSGSGFGK
jgi:dTDP-4-dehydrorhamnose 3,5-epimerase